MKVNLKKIGAIVAGATILASTAAFGALWYGNTKLVDDNGAPVAKVVVGEKAAASDGVGAALIASRMMASAYKSVNLKGQVVGTATCKSGETSESGTCAISDERATIQITVPGAVAEGTYTINTLIGDYLNRRLLDRVANSRGGSDVDYSLTISDTIDYANPFTSNSGVALSDAPSETALYRITGDMFAPLGTKTVRDDDAAKTYTETQNIWVKGETSVYNEKDGVQGKLDLVAYTIKFGGSGNDFGIPVCTTPTDKDYTYCENDDNKRSYATETHKVKIWFLGEPWIISEMKPPSTSLTNDDDLVSGGYIKLAKESVSGLINVGESLSVDNLKFQLDDLEAHGSTTAALISVLDANGNLIKKDKIGASETKELNIDGKLYRLHAYKLGPGYTFAAKWADLAIYSTEIELKSGEELDANGGKNPNWKVALGWKNRDGETDNANTTGNEGRPDHLRTIILYSDKLDELTVNGDGEKMKKDSYIPFVEYPTAWKLTYTGLDITPADMDTLKFKLTKTGTKTFSDALYNKDTNNYARCVLEAPYIQVSSSIDKAFRVKGGYNEFQNNSNNADVSNDVEMNDNTFYISLNNMKCDGVSFYNGILMKAGSHYGFASFDKDTTLDNNTEQTLEVEYDKIGDGDTTLFNGGGVIEIKPLGLSINDSISDGAGSGSLGSGTLEGNLNVDFDSLTDTDYLFVTAEKAGEGTSDDSTDYWIFGLDVDVPTFKYDDYNINGTQVTTDNGDEIFYVYTGPVNSAWSYGIKEDGFTSERGSVFSTLKEDSVEFKMAKKLAKAQFTLTTGTGAATEAESTCQATLAEGQEYVCSGVKVKVTEIKQTVGACTAGGASATCTPDMTGVSAKVVDETGAEVTKAYVPAANAYKGLVVLDRDAAGINTLISVGGDKVNTVTASLLETAPIDWTTERKVVKEVVQGSKIVVAGAEAEDTLEAVSDFIAAVKEA